MRRTPGSAISRMPATRDPGFPSVPSRIAKLLRWVPSVAKRHRAPPARLPRGTAQRVECSCHRGGDRSSGVRRLVPQPGNRDACVAADRLPERRGGLGLPPAGLHRGVAAGRWGSLGASIVDPHGDHLADARAKLRALADFAENHDDRFLRVDSIAKVDDGSLRVLDLTDPDVRAAVRAFPGGKVSALYLSEGSRTFPCRKTDRRSARGPDRAAKQLETPDGCAAWSGIKAARASR